MSICESVGLSLLECNHLKGTISFLFPLPFPFVLTIEVLSSVDEADNDDVSPFKRASTTWKAEGEKRREQAREA